jgi:alpha-N-arabinofuranosidase
MLATTPQAQDHLYTTASLDERTHEIIVTMVNVNSVSRTTEIDLKGVATSGTAKVITLASDDLKAENSLDHPENVALKNSSVEVKSGKISVELKPYSVTVYRIPVH